MTLWTASTPGFSVLHYLPEFAQTHVHWVSDAIQPSHSLLPSSLALNLSQHQGLSQSQLSSGGQIIGASASVLPMKIQGWFPLGLTGLIFYQSKGLSTVFPTPQFKASILHCPAFFMVQLSHPYMTTGKIMVLTIPTFVGKVMSLHFDILSRFVLAFLPRSKCLLISWLQSQFFCKISYLFIVQPFSHTCPFAIPWTTAHQASLSFTISQSSLKLMSIESVMPSSHLILVPFSSCPQSLPASESFPMSQLFAWGGQSKFQL